MADVVCNCIFGFDGKSFENIDFFLKPAEELFQVPWKVKILGRLLDIFPFLYKFLSVPTSMPGANRWFIDMLHKAIELREKCDIQRDDYLNFMMELRMKHKLEIDDVAGYAFTFFFDGYETSNAFLCAGLKFLANNKNAQNRLRNEIFTYENIDYDQLNQMPFLDNVFNGNFFFLIFIKIATFSFLF